jgi:hypothetical protein
MKLFSYDLDRIDKILVVTNRIFRQRPVVPVFLVAVSSWCR